MIEGYWDNNAMETVGIIISNMGDGGTASVCPCGPHCKCGADCACRSGGRCSCCD